MVKVAILGFGVVGSGVAELITKNAGEISDSARRGIELKYILDIRSFDDSPFAPLVVRDFALIESDDEVQVVVETIGGVKAALDFTRRSLKAGKHVVTSNKELVAQYGDEMLALARENNVNYLFEASVGGGIPIIRPINQCLAANKIYDVYGILNGTTNYILTKMAADGSSFGDALAEAKAKGYAEADPADDIEGRDTCRKISILASLSFGHHVYPTLVETGGIEKITAFDIQYARKNGFAVKLLGRATRLDDKKICAYTAPHLVPLETPLAGVNGVFNGIVVNGDAIGQVMFYGRGAGALPTASAVVADVIDAVKHFNAHKFMDWSPAVEGAVVKPDKVPARWYLRAGDKGCITPHVADWRQWAEGEGIGEVELAMRLLEDNE